MSQDTRPTEHELHELFRTAREADTDRLPPFSRMMRAAETAPSRPPGLLRLALVGAVTGVAGTAIALGALWVAEPRSFTVTPEPLLVARRAALPRPAPVVAPAPPEPVRVAPRADVKPRPVVTSAPPPQALPEEVPPVEMAETAPATVADRTELEKLERLLASRDREFKATTTGMSEVDALTGSALVNANSIEEPGGGARVRGIAALPARGGLASNVRPIDPRRGGEPLGTESYAPRDDHSFLAVSENPLSTFSIDVDTASYANVRRFLALGQLPPRDAVRIEELINYFRYDYPGPIGDAPFAASVEISDCPWAPEHRLARIGLAGREIPRGAHPGSNLVFLIDVSGSMDEPLKLPLLKSALALLVEELGARDQVAIVVYAGSSGVALPPTSGAAKDEILDAVDRLEAGGSTNGGAGLALAYRIARENFIPGGVNRVILATDGDFNVGVTGEGELVRRIEEDAGRGIFLTALGFGYGNLKDDRLEHLADRGNGNYAYIDRLGEARKVLVEEMTGTLVTIARDVKIQVEFNPLAVGAYRLIGYENRLLKKEDFNDDRKDAGEIGAGHTVTALYELVPPGKALDAPPVEALKYQSVPAPTEAAEGGELFTVRVRYKEPEGGASRLLSFPVVDLGLALDAASADFKFAAAVAETGLLLRGSALGSGASYDAAEKLAAEGLGADERGLRAEFLEILRAARALADGGRPAL